MVNRRQGTKVAINNSEQNRVSSPGEKRSFEEERISAIYELTDIKSVQKTDADKIIEQMDISKSSLMELVRDVQEQVEIILSGKTK